MYLMCNTVSISFSTQSCRDHVVLQDYIKRYDIKLKYVNKWEDSCTLNFLGTYSITSWNYQFLVLTHSKPTEDYNS